MGKKKPNVPDKYKYDRNEAIKIPERIKRIFTTLKKDGKLLPGQSWKDFVARIYAGQALSRTMAKELTKVLGIELEEGHIIQLQPTPENPAGGNNSFWNKVPEFKKALLGVVEEGNRSSGIKGLNAISISDAVRAGIPIDWEDEAYRYLAPSDEVPLTTTDRVFATRGLNPDMLKARRDLIYQLRAQGVQFEEPTLIEALLTPEQKPTPLAPGEQPFIPRSSGKTGLEIMEYVPKTASRLTRNVNPLTITQDAITRASEGDYLGAVASLAPWGRGFNFLKDVNQTANDLLFQPTGSRGYTPTSKLPIITGSNLRPSEQRRRSEIKAIESDIKLDAQREASMYYNNGYTAD